MRDLAFALGAILAVEGLILAIAPNRLETLLETVREIGPERLRYAGLGFAVVGTVIVALAR